MIRLSNQQWLMVAGVGAFVVWGWWPSLSKKLNPASDENLIYQGVNNAGKEASGDEAWSLGTWAYEQSHGPDGERHWTPLGVARDLLSDDEGKK